MMFGKKEKDLTEGERAQLEQRRKQWAAQKDVDAQMERDAQLQIQLQADEEAKAARVDKKREKKQGARELEATRLTFEEDIPLGTEQEQMSNEELTKQRSMLLAHKAANEELTRAEADRD